MRFGSRYKVLPAFLPACRCVAPRPWPLPATQHFELLGVSGKCCRMYHGTVSLGPTVAKMTFTLSTSDVRAQLRRIEQWSERNTLWEHWTSGVLNGAVRL